MKKYIGFITLLICSCLFLGCNNVNKYKENFTEEEQHTTNVFADYKYENGKAQVQSVKHSAIAEDGYYYVACGVLYFYDIAHDSNVPLCSNAGCNHNSKACPGYVYKINPSSTGLDSMDTRCNCDALEVFYYNDKIYMVELNSEDEYFLNQYDSNFNNKQTVAAIAKSNKNETVYFESSVASLIDNGYFYYYNYSFDPNGIKENNYMITFNCMRVKLEVGATPEVLGTFPFGADYAWTFGAVGPVNLFISQNEVYYVAGGTSRIFTTLNPVQGTIARYSIASGEYELLWSYSGDYSTDLWGKDTGTVRIIKDNVCMDNQKNLYILNDSSEIIKVSFSDKKSNVIYKSSKTIEQIACDGDRLYIIETKEEMPPILLAIDQHGKCIAKYDFKYSADYLKMIENRKNITLEYNAISMYVVDDRYIMVGAECNAYEGLMGEGSTAYSILPGVGKQTGIGLIEKAKFLAGEEVSIKQIYTYAK